MAETKTPGNDGAPTRPPAGRALALFGAVLFLAALLRVWSAGGDLWLDEVWSLYNLDLARAGPSAGRSSSGMSSPQQRPNTGCTNTTPWRA